MGAYVKEKIAIMLNPRTPENRHRNKKVSTCSFESAINKAFLIFSEVLNRRKICPRNLIRYVVSATISEIFSLISFSDLNDLFLILLRRFCVTSFGFAEDEKSIEQMQKHDNPIKKLSKVIFIVFLTFVPAHLFALSGF